MQGQVTRSRQVTSPHKSLNARQSYTDWKIALKLSAIDTRNSVYKMFVSEFLYWWHKDGQVNFVTFIISQWEEIEKRLFWSETILNTLKHQITSM